MNATRLFGEFDRAEPKFEYIPSVKIPEPPKDWSEVWDKLIELGGCGCWIYYKPIDYRIRIQIQKFLGVVGKGRRCATRGCLNPAHWGANEKQLGKV